MSLPTHHPAEELLIRYASGDLNRVKALLVATHLAGCPSCRARVRRFEAVCGAWFERLDAPGKEGGGDLDALLARLEDRLDGMPAAAVDARPPPSPPVVGWPVAQPLRSALGTPLEDCRWNDVAPGIRLSEWGMSDDITRACLLGIDAGRPVPPHHHTAGEILLVLKGAFADEYGRFEPGDVVEYQPDSDHHATANPDGECVCLFLLDGDIVFL